MNASSDQQVTRQMLRHTLATVAYRCAKCLANAPAGFDQYRVGEKTRTPGEILGHLGDLFDWALSIAQGEQKWQGSAPLPWEQEVERFFGSLQTLDDYLASESPLGCPAERLFQGPIADALTHVGQIAMLRRLVGAPIKGENYFKAEITAGKLASASSETRVEVE